MFTITVGSLITVFILMVVLGTCVGMMQYGEEQRLEERITELEESDEPGAQEEIELLREELEKLKGGGFR